MPTVDSWTQWTQTQYQGQTLSFLPDSPSPSPTIPTLKWQRYAFSGDWQLHTTAGDLLATLHNVNILFQYDPTYPDRNPCRFTFTCTITTANWNGHYWQTAQYPQPVFALTVMGKNGYSIIENVYLGDFVCMPWDVPVSFGMPFDPAQWDSINYCTIEVGRLPQAIWRRHDQVG